jgi:hypothetical protein
MGTWLPGAVEALDRMCLLGHVTIWTCRIAPVDPHGPVDPVTWRDPKHVVDEIGAIRSMLYEEGLDNVEIWTRPYKPPADYYIDNKAVRYMPTVGWSTTMHAIENIFMKGGL